MESNCALPNKKPAMHEKRRGSAALKNAAATSTPQPRLRLEVLRRFGFFGIALHVATPTVVPLSASSLSERTFRTRSTTIAEVICFMQA